MRRHFLALGVGALCLTLAPSLAFGQQGNTASALAQAAGSNTTIQAITQGGGSSSAAQSATTLQVLPLAAAPAVAPQIVPVNVNLPVRVLSPGDDGPVEQSNAATAEAEAYNANTTEQSVAQGSAHHSKKGGSDEGGSASQSATTVQVAPIAVAPAVAPQVVPVNVNLPVRVLSPGDDGEVSQSNEAVAQAWADNSNDTAQFVKQGGSGAVSQSATTVQVAPIAAAPSLAPQVLPVNLSAPVSVVDELPALPVDPAAVLADPVGTILSLVGTLPVSL